MIRLFRASALALLLALVPAVPTKFSVDINPCAHLTPDDTFLWWFFGCGKDSAGGGGGGAG